jgi:hypothetical protein
MRAHPTLFENAFWVVAEVTSLILRGNRWLRRNHLATVLTGKAGAEARAEAWRVTDEAFAYPLRLVRKQLEARMRRERRRAGGIDGNEA